MIPVVSPMYLLIAYRKSMSGGAQRLLLESLFAEALLVVIIGMYSMGWHTDEDRRGLIMLVSLVCVVLLGVMFTQKAAWHEIGRLNAFPKGYLYTWFIIEFVASLAVLAHMISSKKKKKDNTEYLNKTYPNESFTDAPRGNGRPT